MTTFEGKIYSTCEELYEAHKQKINDLGEAAFAGEKFNQAWKALGGSIKLGEKDTYGDNEQLYYGSNGLIFTVWMSYGISHRP